MAAQEDSARAGAREADARQGPAFDESYPTEHQQPGHRERQQQEQRDAAQTDRIAVRVDEPEALEAQLKWNRCRGDEDNREDGRERTQGSQPRCGSVE